MDLTDYRLNAYKKAAGERSPSLPDQGSSAPAEPAPQSISRSIRSQYKPGHEPLIHKPIFQKVNTKLDQIMGGKESDRKTEQQARQAARTGTWFEKGSPTTEDVQEATRQLTSGGLIKVPEAPKKDGETDSIYRRVAKFLVIIGVDEAAKIMPHLTEEQTEKIIPEIASIRNVSPEEAEQVLAEFHSLVEKAREEGGIDTARTILTKAYGSQKAEEVLNRSVQFPNGKPFEYLADANPERICVLLEGETDAVQALVLSQLEPKKAASVIKAMDETAKKNVMLRLAKLKPVAPEVLSRIDKTLHEKMLTQNTENSQNLDGRGVLAQILRRMDPGMEMGIITSLSAQDPELGADLRKRLFTEDDVIASDDRYLQNLLHDMAIEEIAVLIHGKTDAFRSKILGNVSKNRASVILDEESYRGHMLRSEIERETSQFYAMLRRAWEHGDLRIKGRDDGEVYV
ncbi:MAG: flagellar motor switch protein FliG [Treponema sp.]|nr:flagellar motor switch protein FliG [Treponema sp.]